MSSLRVPVVHVGKEASSRRRHNWCRKKRQGGLLAEHCLNYHWNCVIYYNHCSHNYCCGYCGFLVVAAVFFNDRVLP